jgi:hypothetical protein
MGANILLKWLIGLVRIIGVITASGFLSIITFGTRLVTTRLIAPLLIVTALTGLTGLESTTLRSTVSRAIAIVATLTRQEASFTGLTVVTSLTGLTVVASLLVIATCPRAITGALRCATLQTCTKTFRTEAALILFMIVVTRTLIGWTLSAVNTWAR